MKNNLYYTPEINELHIGFECEVLGLIGAKEDQRLFSQTTIISEKELPILHLLEFRVKYLDQSDIESLGWLDGELRGMTSFIFNEMDPDNEFQLYYQFDNQFAQIYNCHSEFVFQGTIKNKSELIKLMNQLNINNNVKEF